MPNEPKPGDKSRCKVCDGSGRVRHMLGNLKCGACNGTGTDSDLGFVENVKRQVADPSAVPHAGIAEVREAIKSLGRYITPDGLEYERSAVIKAMRLLDRVEAEMRELREVVDAADKWATTLVLLDKAVAEVIRLKAALKKVCRRPTVCGGCGATYDNCRLCNASPHDCQKGVLPAHTPACVLFEAST